MVEGICIDQSSHKEAGQQIVYKEVDCENHRLFQIEKVIDWQKRIQNYDDELK